jgi:hypothetical protein
MRFQTLGFAFILQNTNKKMLFGGFVATLAAVSWGFVYAFTQDILTDMSPINLLTATYLFAGLLSVVPYAFLGEQQDLVKGIKANPTQFSVYIILILAGKFFMILSVKLIGATAASLIEISYVSYLRSATASVTVVKSLVHWHLHEISLFGRL